jgi:hypothetical protein
MIYLPRFRLALSLLLAASALLLLPSRAAAQRFSFDRTLQTGPTPELDVTTNRGKIVVSTGQANQIVVHGTVTVRVAWDAPANAVALAQAAAKDPVIDQSGNTVRLRPPADDETQRAVTVSYEIEVPAEATVIAVSDSGATSIRGTRGKVSVKTSSAQIELANLGGEVEIQTGSGAVSLAGAGGHVTVSTSSSGIELRDIRAGLHARTQSGAISATFSGQGDVDVETGSSAITLEKVDGGLTARSTSGRIDVTGTPRAPWNVSTTSGSQRLSLASDASFQIDARTSSGSIVVQGVKVDGTVEKQHVSGSVGTGGPVVTLQSRSGSIRLRRI